MAKSFFLTFFCFESWDFTNLDLLINSLRWIHQTEFKLMSKQKTSDPFKKWFQASAPGSHTGEKPYHSSHCNKRLDQLSQLKTHQLFYTAEKPYDCIMCEKSFLRSQRRNRTGGMSLTKARLVDRNRITGGSAGNASPREEISAGTPSVRAAEKPYHCEPGWTGLSQSGIQKTHLCTHTAKKKSCCCSVVRGNEEIQISKDQELWTHWAEYQDNPSFQMCHQTVWCKLISGTGSIHFTFQFWSSSWVASLIFEQAKAKSQPARAES